MRQICFLLLSAGCTQEHRDQTVRLEVLTQDNKITHKCTGRGSFVFRGMEKHDQPAEEQGRCFYFFSPAELNELNDWKQNSKSFINPHKEHVASAYSIFPYAVFHTLPPPTFHSPPLPERLCDRESSQAWNVILWTRIFLFLS